MFLFHRLILRQMRRERSRALLAVLGVALGVAVMLAIQLANRGSLSGFQKALDAVSGKAALEITAPPLGIDEGLIPELTWLREIGIATPVVEADVMAVMEQGSEMLHVIGVDALRDPALRDYDLMSRSGRREPSGASEQTTSARQPLPGMDLMRWLSEPDTMLVTAAFAQRWGLKADDKLQLVVGDRQRACVIAGILNADAQESGNLANQPLGVMDIANAQSVLGRPGRVDRLEVRLHEGIDIEKAEQMLRVRLPGALTVQRPERRSAAVEKMLAAFHFNLTMLSGIALVVGLFLIYNTVSVAVMTRRPEIGMLRTLGVTRGQILRLFWGEALLLGLIGALLGVPMAKLLAEGVMALTATTVDTLFVATAAQVPALGWRHWLGGLSISVPLSLLSAAMPALEATRVAPVEAMRGMRAATDTQTGCLARTRSRRFWRGKLPRVISGGRLGRAVIPILCVIAGTIAVRQPPVSGMPLWGYFVCICAIVGMAVLVAPLLAVTARWGRPVLGRLFGIEGRLAASQIRASTHRLSVSVAALAVSLALTVAIAVMVGSFRATVLYWVDQTMGADLYVRPGIPARSQSPPTLSEPTLKLLRGHPAVLAFDAYRSMDMPVGDRIVKLSAGDFDIILNHGRLALKTPGDPKAIMRAAKERGGILVSESFALHFGVKEGDRVTLTTGTGPREFQIAALFYDYSTDSGTISMDWRWFQESFGQSPPTHAAVYLKPGSDAERVREEMMERLAGRGFVAIFTNAGLRAEVLRIFDSTFAITWALEIIAVLVAMAGVAATMLTLLLERRQEIRLLRIAGADTGQVRRTIVIESGIIGAVSQALGLLVGILLSLVLIRVINPQSFGWSIRLHTPWVFLAGSTVLVVAGTMVAGLYPAWRATREPLQVMVE